MDKSTGEWQEPDQSHQDRHAGDDLSIDETLLGPGFGFVETMQVLADDASDDLNR